MLQSNRIVIQICHFDRNPNAFYWDERRNLTLYNLRFLLTSFVEMTDLIFIHYAIIFEIPMIEYSSEKEQVK